MNYLKGSTLDRGDAARGRADCLVGSIITDISPNDRARAAALRSFGFRHSLAEHPSLTVEKVRAMGRRLLEAGRYDQVRHAGGFTPPDDRMDEVDRVRAAQEALDAIERSQAWIRLTRVNDLEPEFATIASEFLADASELCGIDLAGEVQRTLVTLFISSPGQVTPYHMDHTWNNLLQVRGSKTVYLFDPHDPSVLPDGAVEKWYMETDMHIAEAHPSLGVAYPIAPGEGVHHPVNAPHWVQNGPEVSVSLSLGFCLRRATRLGYIHQANGILRSLGVRPGPVGQSPRRDELKATIIGALGKRRPRTFDDYVFRGKRRLTWCLRRAGVRV